MRVLIDPGHGGKDSGATSIFKGQRIYEKDLALELSILVKQLLEKEKINVSLTRLEDKDLSLQQRLDLANSIKPDFFLSIHFNSASTVGKGFEVLLRTIHSARSRTFADILRKNLGSVLNIPDRGIKLGRWYVLVYQPSALLEVCFINNEKEMELYFSKKKEVANAIAKSFLDFRKAL